MAIGNISQFSSMIGKGKYARKNQYEFRLYPPTGVSYKGGSLSELMMRCESVTLPGRNLASNEDNLRLGPGREHVYNLTYAPITAVFLSDDKLSEKVFFEDWQNLIFNLKTNKPGYYNDYKADMTVNQLNDLGETVYTAKLIDAWPKTVTQLDLSAADTDLHRISVEIAFYRWEKAEAGPVL